MKQYIVMPQFLQLLKRFRLPNIIMIIISQAIVFYIMDFNASMFPLLFYITLGSIFIAMGGYFLNDYFDIEIDAINKPYLNIVAVDLRWYAAIFFLNGLIFGAIAAYYTNLNYFLLFILSAVILVFYALFFSKYKIIGNILISFLVALSPLIVYIMLFDYWTTDYNFERLVIIYGYVIMAFILNWIREIIKDMEDIPGDQKFERKSLPIVFGIGVSKLFVALLFIMFVVFFTGATAYFFHFIFTIILQIIAFIFAYYLINAEEKSDFTRLSTFIKIIMFVGLLTPLFIF